MCIILPGGYRGWCEVKAIELSEGCTPRTLALSLAVMYSDTLRSPDDNSTADVGSKAQHPQQTILHVMVFH